HEARAEIAGDSLECDLGHIPRTFSATRWKPFLANAQFTVVETFPASRLSPAKCPHWKSR
ncbi:hypothetical protein, partial [Mobiluncus mulieris]|uniref:hypothetical protein n=1 Tax=Mobiluncus mulieris TaxID=2052 RepID=UPI0021E347FA